jgi:hypothetical protein
MLSERCVGVAVIIAITRPLALKTPMPPVPGAGVLREQVHEADVQGGLLGTIGVVLARCVGLRAIQLERIGRAGAIGGVEVRVVVQEGRDQPFTAGEFSSAVKASSPTGLVAFAKVPK